jgi:hypothetical protein
MHLRARARAGLFTALLLGLAALLLALAELHEHYAGLLHTQVSQAAFASVLHSPVLRGAVVLFLAAQILLHALLGLLAWLAARLTIQTRPALGHRPRWLVAAWFLAFYVFVGLANAVWFPWSVSGAWFRVLSRVVPGGGMLPVVVATLIVLVLLGQLGVLLWRSRWRRAGVRALVWSSVLWGGAAVLIHMPRAATGGATATARPNLVLIGIDSLRNDLVGMSGEPGYTPNVSAFLRESHYFPDTITPLARTFPSWIALLTGRGPMATGVRENLLPRSAIHTGATLGERLRAHGYRSVFATDEVRFSNIDRSYGFEQTITPRVGASDFVLGALGDIPLSNLLSGTWVARWLFPDTFGNRAAAVTYRPQSFVDRVGNELRLRDGQPLFLALHLTLPHWPYHWAADEDEVFARTTDQSYSYLAAVVAADRQFGQLLQGLTDRGVLDNAIVVVFSDHGEALGLPSDNLIHSRAAKAAAGRVLVWMNGHGTSVLSPMQYRVVLGVRGYGVTAVDVAPAQHAAAALSLEDLAPTLYEVLGIDVPRDQFDGRSFAAALRNAAGAAPADSLRIRYTETAFSTPSLRSGSASTESLLHEGGLYFRVDPDSGRFEVDMRRWGELLALKERAAVGREWLLAALPDATPGHHDFIAVPLAGGLPQRLRSAPDARMEPELSALWHGLHEHFPGEIGAAAQD